jgi:hypothetical protein
MYLTSVPFLILAGYSNAIYESQSFAREILSFEGEQSGVGEIPAHFVFHQSIAI